MEDGLGKERQKVALRREKGALQHPKQDKQHCPRNKSKNGQRGEKKHSNTKEPYKCGKNTHTHKNTE